MMKKHAFLSLAMVVVFLVACKTSPKRMEEADVHFKAAKRLYSKGETIQSLAEAQNAASIDGRNEEIQNFLGLLYAERGEQAKALEYFKKAVRLKPDYSEAQNNLCAFLYQQNKFDEALSHCRKAVENVTYSTPERAYNNMGLIYEKKGDQVKAAEMHQKALIHNKKFVMSLLFLGRSSYERKEYEKAKEFLESANEACVASPRGSWGISCPESQYQLALTYLQLKQTKNAVQAFQNCMTSDVTGGMKTKCEKNLQMYR